MNAFWSFARRMLHYRGLMAGALAAALLDAACAFGGFSALMLVIEQLFGSGQTVRDVIAEKLAHPRVQAIVGDLSPLVERIPEDPLHAFAMVLGFILVLAILGSVMRYLHQSLIISVSLRTVMRIRRAAFHRLVQAPLEVILTQGTADNLSRIVRDCTLLGRGFNALMGKAVRDVLMGSAFLLLALLIDPVLTGIFLVGLPVIAICIRKFGKRIRRATKAAMRAYGWMVGAVQESMQAISVVKVHNAEGYERRRFNTINRRVFEQEMRARTARALSSPVIELIAIVGVMTVSLAAAWYVYRQGGEPTAMAQVLLALGMAGGAFRPLANLNNDLQESAAAARRIQEILELPVEPGARAEGRAPSDAPPTLAPLPRHRRDIRFEHVTYRYPTGDRPAVNDVSLDVEHGQTVAIVGPNGSGKSTLLSLLPRLMEPTGGRILVDGTDIATVSLRSLRRQIAVVTQQTVLFEGTIADNIAYGRPSASREAIEAAARAAYAHDFITALPHGYDTPLGEAGAGLSGGQRQRLAIARAILRDPAILILDEATSQIDTESEAKINQALAEFRQGRTTFVIAHRLSTVIDADQIVVMVDGRITDQGTHGELLERCATYQTLTRTQLHTAPAGS